MSAGSRSRQRWRSWAVVVMIAWALAPGWARAGSSEDLESAAKLFRAAKTAYERGDFTAAARSFELAYQKAPRTPAIYAAALAWESARDRPRAARAFQRAVEAGDLPEKDARDAEQRLAALKMELGELVIRAPAGVTASVGSLDDGLTPVRVYVEPGQHEVVFKSEDGARRKRTASVEPGRIAFVEVDTLSSAPTPEQPRVERRETAPQTSSSETTRLLAWTAFGGAAVALGASAYLWNDALSARDDWEADPKRTNIDARDRASSRATWTNASLGATVVLGSLGAVLWISSDTSKTDEAPAAAALLVQPGGGRFAVTF